MASPSIPTPLTLPDRNDGTNGLLLKIGLYIAAVIKGSVGFLVRGTVATAPAQTSSAPSNASILTSATGSTVETLAAGERLFIQNLDTDPLFVRRAAAATTSAFHYELQGGGAADDGTGGAIWIEDHIGAVSIAGTTPRFMAWKV